MFERFRRFGERLATFTEWVRLYPHILTRAGRESVMEDLLLLGAIDKAFLDEMAVYAERILSLKAEADIRFVSAKDGIRDVADATVKTNGERTGSAIHDTFDRLNRGRLKVEHRSAAGLGIRENGKSDAPAVPSFPEENCSIDSKFFHDEKGD